MTQQQHFEAGQLQEAIDEALADVKKNPAKPELRVLLCELLCFAGDLERADKQLDTIAMQAPDAVMGISLFRQLIRCEQSRREFYTDGRVPEFLDEPTPMQQLQLQASIEIRAGEPGKAMELLEQAEEIRPDVSGTCDGEKFDEFRDLDDLVSSSLELYTPNGKYYWIPLERLEQLSFRAPQYPRDLMWRAAHMVVQGGTEGEVYLPVLYHGSHEADDNQLKLGRATDWVGEEGEPVRGRGQRTFLVGEEDKPALAVGEIQFETAGT